MKPSKTDLVLEIPRAALEIIALPFASYLNNVPAGGAHPILVLPGFMGGDSSTYFLRRYLSSLGHVVYGWGQGANLGPQDHIVEHMEERFEHIYSSHGEPVTIIGHSLGGAYARKIAKDEEDKVRSIITLGSPVHMPEVPTFVVDLFTKLNSAIPVEWVEDLEHPPCCPTTLIYTKSDGILHPKHVLQPNCPSNVVQIEVKGSHTGLGCNPSTLYTIAIALSFT